MIDLVPVLMGKMTHPALTADSSFSECATNEGFHEQLGLPPGAELVIDDVLVKKFDHADRTRFKNVNVCFVESFMFRGCEVPNLLIQQGRVTFLEKVVDNVDEDFGLNIAGLRAHLFDSDSAVMRILRQHVGQDVFYTSESDEYNAVCVSNRQGNNLISGKMAYIVQMPDGSKQICVTAEKLLIDKVVDRWDLSDPMMAEHVQRVDQRLGFLQTDKLMPHSKYVQTRRDTALRALAVLGLINRQRVIDGVPPLDIISEQDHPILRAGTVENEHHSESFQTMMNANEFALDDFSAAGMQRNSFDGNRPSPWMFCSLILVGYRQDSKGEML